MRKIAIVKYVKYVDSYNYDFDSYSNLIAHSITDWQEVSDDDYKLLLAYAKTKNIAIVEQPISQVDEIASIIAEFKALAKKREQEEAAISKLYADRKAAEARKKQERAEKKLLKEAETRKKLFEKLQAEFGDGNGH